MSTSSIEQDESLVMQFRKTPRTPMKNVNQTPRNSSRKRCLFRQTSPNSSPEKSDDLGPMYPLSDSSNDSYVSCTSALFSPNGELSTPPKTPVRSSRGERKRVNTNNIGVTSSLFPMARITPTLGRGPLPKQSESLDTKNESVVSNEDIPKDWTTPPKSSKKLNKSGTDGTKSYTSQNNCDSNAGLSGTSLYGPPNSKFGIKPISSDSFYGPAPLPPKVKTQLFSESSGPARDAGKRTRSRSMESNSSNMSFVSGKGRQRKRRVTTETFTRARTSRKNHQKGTVAGVWHGVKKPKKMKPTKGVNKNFISPKSRVAKMLMENKEKLIQVKPKRLFEEKPKRRVVRKMRNTEGENNQDSFPHHLGGTKKLQTSSHPSQQVVEESPDPRKKFLKYGIRKKATLTLNDNLKLEFSDGTMKIHCPKKRKLYSAKNNMFFDFCEDEDNNSEVKENIDYILSKLDEDGPERTPVKANQMTEEELIGILDSPQTKVRLVNLTSRKILTNIQNDTESAVAPNLSSLANSGCPGEETSKDDTFTSGSPSKELSLGKTGSLLSCTRNILTNTDVSLDSYPLSEDETMEIQNCEKFYSLFYKENWNNITPCKESTSKGSPKKKSIKVPDDQYLLDAGQKSIGIVTCGKCGVMYQAGDFADEATHKNFHDHLPELRFNGWTNERIVGRYLDGRVIMIMNVDPKAWWCKVTKIVDIVDQELGFAEGSVKALHYKTIYLFINDKAKQIVGCLIAEECKEAYKMLPPAEGIADSCSKDPSPCKVGISRIWTALNQRRRGVATRLIDCMRRNFIFGEIIPMDLVAFSVPSPSGKLLAQNVTGKLDFLVYGF